MAVEVSAVHHFQAPSVGTSTPGFIPFIEFSRVCFAESLEDMPAVVDATACGDEIYAVDCAGRLLRISGDCSANLCEHNTAPSDSTLQLEPAASATPSRPLQDLFVQLEQRGSRRQALELQSQRLVGDGGKMTVGGSSWILPLLPERYFSFFCRTLNLPRSIRH